MKVKIRPLLIHNPFQRKEKLTYFSKAIRIATGSRWNHIAIVIILPNGDEWVIESVGRGVIYTRYEEWRLKGPRTVKPLNLPGREFDLATIEALIGLPYGRWDIARIAWHLLLTRGFKLDREWKPLKYKKYGLVCTEVLSLILEDDPGLFKVPADFEFDPRFAPGPEFNT